MIGPMQQRARTAGLPERTHPPALTTLGRQLVLGHIAQLIEPHAASRSQAAAALARAREQVRPLLELSEPTPVYETFVAEALVELALDDALRPDGMCATLAAIERLAEVSPITVGLRALSDPRLLALPLEATVAAITALLRTLAPASAVEIRTGESPGGDPAGAVAAPVHRWRQPCAAVVCVPEPGHAANCAALAARAAALLGPAFERASLVEDNAERCTALLRSSELRLTRLAFDLHDGPLQDVALLVGELKSLRRAVAAGRSVEDLLAPIDDIAGLVAFLDGELRDIATSSDAPSALRRPFPEAIASVVRTFSARSEIEPELELSGDFATMTDSQRIALLRIVQQSLTNVRDHSGATHVRISIAAHRSHIDATVADDGCGFDVERALDAAGRNDRMGLVGMIERVRLLGGRCDILSRPGEGTSVTLVLSRWTAGAGGRQAPAVAA